MRNGRLTLLAIAVSGAFAAGPAHAAPCTPGAVDKPDLGFVDSNCDGIDGDKAAAIFVAPNGDDNNNGSFGSPMRTVQKAVDVAQPAHKDVYVAGGVYDGKVSFLGNSGPVGVYGGYDPQTWQRSAANLTTLEAPGQVVGVAVPGIVLQLLTIHGFPGGTTSYGVRSFDAGAAVALSRVSIQTSDGAGGANGADASQTPPAKADDGDQGVADPKCDDVNGPWALGGQGGIGVLDGGNGGSAPYGYPWAGFAGQSDPDNPSVVGGGGGKDPYITGQPGTPGKQGLYGFPGLGDVNSVALFYQPLAGGTGHDGTPGAGGGGGAASSYLCIPGSGGGAGGVGGSGGAGGKGGGGSIGVFAGTGSRVLVLDGSVIHTATGGNGGTGGLGQPGGQGGDGGPAGVDIFVHKYPSGAGGAGGKGGAGGRGGGGAGGASIGVLAVDSRAVVSQDTTIVPGAGGKGGIGGYTGWQGRAEKSEQVASAKGAIPAVGDFDGDGVADDADGCPIAPGPNNGCPADAPSGPVAGDPTATAPAPSAPGTGAVATVAVLPASSCVAKRVFTIRINVRRARIRTARLTLDGHRLKVVKGKRRWTAKVDLRHSAATRHTLTIRGTLRSGRRFRQTRHYRTCATS
jgi:hypothetical protein